MLLQLNHVYTRQPPHSDVWAGTNSASDAAEQPGAQMVGAQALVLENWRRSEVTVSLILQRVIVKHLLPTAGVCTAKQNHGQLEW